MSLLRSLRLRQKPNLHRQFTREGAAQHLVGGNQRAQALVDLAVLALAPPLDGLHEHQPDAHRDDRNQHQAHQRGHHRAPGAEIKIAHRRCPQVLRSVDLRPPSRLRGVPRAGFVYIGAARLPAGLPRAQRHQVTATWPARRATLAPMPSIAALPHYNYDALDHVGQSLVYRLKPIKHNPATKSSARHLLKQERARNIQPMQYGQCKPKDQ